MKKYTIVGGGTAGWLTALYVKKKCPEYDVTVIASSEIGILGAGEGTTPNFVSFLELIDIPVNDIIEYAKGTFKNGIKFTNWNGDGKNYHHFFQVHYDQIIKETNGKVALHFDANLLAKYLQSVGLKRGIELIDDEVVGINTDSDGYISDFKLKSGLTTTTDFVFDCSGFRRLIIGNFYKSKWNSYKDYLPVNRAMPFFLQNDSGDLPPYTESIAMKYGWMWKIPVKGRYGCGYVFDSSYVSDEEIKAELEKYLGHEINSPRMFSFEPGCYEDICIKNCIAIGLSAGFVEPLEATSILVSILMLRNWNNIKTEIENKNSTEIEILNMYSKRINKDILNFIHFHYLTKRNDSKFWTDFSTKNKKLPFIEDFSDVMKTSLPEQSILDYLTAIETIRDGTPKINFTSLFKPFSWLQVGVGINFFNLKNEECLTV
jgi:tryptophan halogenase